MSKKAVANLSYIYVESNYRNNKIATKLIDEFLFLMKKSLVEIIEVKCYKDNVAANNLYKKYGFDVLYSSYRKRI